MDPKTFVVWTGSARSIVIDDNDGDGVFGPGDTLRVYDVGARPYENDVAKMQKQLREIGVDLKSLTGIKLGPLEDYASNLRCALNMANVDYIDDSSRDFFYPNTYRRLPEDAHYMGNCLEKAKKSAEDSGFNPNMAVLSSIANLGYAHGYRMELFNAQEEAKIGNKLSVLYHLNMAIKYAEKVDAIACDEVAKEAIRITSTLKHE